MKKRALTFRVKIYFLFDKREGKQVQCFALLINYNIEEDLSFIIYEH